MLYKDLLIVTAIPESESLIAFDKKTGDIKWKTKASGLISSWGTPVLVEIDEKRTDLVLGVPYEIWGLNPETGKLRWYCEAIEGDSFYSSVAVDKDVVYAIDGRGGGSIAVRAGGKGDVSQSHVNWKGRDTNRFGSPLAADGKVFFIANNIANALDAATGEGEKTRLEGGRSGGGRGSDGVAGGRGRPGGEQGGGGRGEQGRGGQGGRAEQPGGRGEQGGGRGGGGFGGRGGGGGFGGDYGSPVLADGKLFYTSRTGDTFVLKVGEKLEQVSVNKLGEDETFGSTPAISDGQIFIRSNKHLYCISKSE